MSDVALTLRSKNGHFSVKQGTFKVQGLLQWGTTKNATWEITGVSAGTDALLDFSHRQKKWAQIFELLRQLSSCARNSRV
jgi:hypothetical protein